MGFYEIQNNIWKDQIKNIFGVDVVENVNEIDQEYLDKISSYWNSENKIMIKEILFGKIINLDLLEKGSLYFTYKYSLNLYAKFNLGDNVKTINLLNLPIFKNNFVININNTDYVFRAKANYNYHHFKIVGDDRYVKYKNKWIYDKVEDVFEKSPEEILNSINENSKFWLSNVFGEEVTINNFKQALLSIPELDENSILNYYFSGIEDLAVTLKNNKLFINPNNNTSVNINIPKIILSKKAINDSNDNNSNIVLYKNNIQSIEDYRSVILNKSFGNDLFKDSNNFFDPFKTSTNKFAGKIRLLYDNVFFEDGLLWFKNDDGKAYNQFDSIVRGVNNDHKYSMLTSSLYSVNNAPKRIMMTSKLKSQAIPLIYENDNFYHSIDARVVFMDYKGLNYGDSIIISESFAKKLTSKVVKSINFYDVDKDLINELKIGEYINKDLFNQISKKNIYRNYINNKLINVDFINRKFTVESIVPFSIGDKITNFHGSKGVVSIILPDGKMPKLVHKCGNMEPGPFDIILSELSIYKRRSFGQIAEAFSKATNIYADNILSLTSRYSEEIREFAKNSLVEVDGDVKTYPLGINSIIRLEHTATSKEIFSPIRNNYNSLLKFEEMLLLNLSSRNMKNMISEFDIRAISKQYDSIYRSIKMMRTGNLDENTLVNKSRFIQIFKALGYNILIGSKNKDIDKYFDIYSYIISNKKFEEYDED